MESKQVTQVYWRMGQVTQKLLVFLQFISVPILTFLNIFKWTAKFCGFSKMLNLVDFYIIQGVWIWSIILQDHSQGLNLVIIHICLFMMLCGIWMVWHYHHWSSPLSKKGSFVIMSWCNKTPKFLQRLIKYIVHMLVQLLF